MRKEKEGHVYTPYRLKPNKELAKKLLCSMGLEPDLSIVPPTYMIFLRGEACGVDLFKDLDIPRNRALHGGQRYEWFAPVGWDDELEVTARIKKLTAKESKSGKLWFAEIEFEYRTLPARTLALRETTRVVKRG